MAAILALVVGALYLLARLLRLGVLATFLSRPILTGFFAGVSLSILIGQIGRMTGVKIEAEGLVGPLVELAQKAGSIHLPTLLLAAAMFVLLQVVRMTRFPVPGPVLVVVLAVLLSALFDFEGRGIAVVGDIPAGLPALTLPRLAGLPVDTIVLGAAAIFLVSFGAGIVTARSFGAQAGYAVDPNRELTGFGAANLAAGLFGAFPVTASDSRTAVNLTVGGRSQVAGLVAAAALVATLLFLGPALRVLPIPALGAILAATALNLIDLAALRRIWRVSRDGVRVRADRHVGSDQPRRAERRRHRDWRDPRLPPAQDDVPARRHARPDPGPRRLLQAAPRAGCPPGAGARALPDPGQPAFLQRRPRPRPPERHRRRPAAGHSVVRARRQRHRADRQHRRRDAQEVATDFAGRGVSLGIAELHAEPKALLERAGLVEQIGPAMIFEDVEDALRAFGTSEGAGHQGP